VRKRKRKRSNKEDQTPAKRTLRDDERETTRGTKELREEI